MKNKSLQKRLEKDTNRLLDLCFRLSGIKKLSRKQQKDIRIMEKDLYNSLEELKC